MTLTKALLALMCVALAMVVGTVFYALRERVPARLRRSAE